VVSVKSTQKITRAMKMVAAARLRRAQDRILQARPYARKMGEMLSRLSRGVPRQVHPLLQQRPVRRVELVMITADRGLCGAFNANLLRRALELIREQKARGLEVGLLVVGRKARDFFRRRNIELKKEWVSIFDRLSYRNAVEIAQEIITAFTSGRADECYLVYNEFKTIIQQRVTVERLLPIDPGRADAGPQAGNYLIEPSEEEVLYRLLPHHIEGQVYRCLLESAAAELGARMTAMDAATRNAGELIRKLTLLYNKTRQAAITKELMDIVGGAEALRATTGG
jgi:F-type H+-transporting ATPase subunit gamma